MKRFLFGLIRSLTIVAVFLALIPISGSIYRSFDEKLTPETDAFFKEDPTLQQKIQETEVRLNQLNYEQLKKIVPESTTCPKEGALSLETWNQIKKNNPKLLDFANEITTGPTLYFNQQDISGYGRQILKLRPIFRVMENEYCSLEKQGLYNEALDLHYKLARTSWNTATTSNGNLAAFINFGMFSTVLNKINEIERMQPQLKRVDLKNQFKSDYKSTNLLDLAYLQAKADSKITFNSFNSLSLLQDQDYLSAIKTQYLHINKAKNRLVRILPELINNTNYEKPIINTSDSNQQNTGDILLAIIEQRLLGVKTRYNQKFKTIAEELSVEPVQLK